MSAHTVPDVAQSRPPHPVGQLVEACLRGDFPEADGSWAPCVPWRRGVGAVVCVTGFALVAAPLGNLARLDALKDKGIDVDGFGGAAHPEVVMALADGWVDTLDVLLARRGTQGAPAAPDRGMRWRAVTPDSPVADHPRIARALELRDDVRLGAVPDVPGVVVAARGIGGLTELSFEVEPDEMGRGHGRRLLEAALASVPADETVVAAAAPGNTRSLRALLATGFVPVGSVHLFTTAA